MIDARLMELMNREVDGENSPEESAELERVLETNADARAYYDDLVELGRRFGEAGEVTPPATLRSEILSLTSRRPAAERRPAVGRPAARRRRSLIPDDLRNLFTPRVAYAFAAGVAAGAVLLALVTGAGIGTTAVDPNALRGTLAPWEPPSDIDAGECLEFDVPGGWGSGCISYSSGNIWAELHLDTDGETEVVFVHDGDVRFDRFQVVEAGEHSVSVSSGRASLTHTGLGDYVIFFEDEDSSLSPLGVEVYAAGELQFEKRIQPVRE
ncbi:MAG: hypothetical protein ABIG03_02030 [Candidatus Eisenbacteria bacterium]